MTTNSPPLQFPELFIARLQQIYKNTTDEVLDSFNQDKPTTFRVNTLKSTVPSVEATLDSLALHWSKISWLDNCYTIPRNEFARLRDSPLFTNGNIYVQSVASMLPALVLNPGPGEKILDITAAPGSKTSQIAALQNNTGLIVANDVSFVRTQKLKANLRTQGVTNTTISNKPAQRLWERYPEYFDKVLADVPCSMEGRICPSENELLDDWSVSKIEELHKRQCWILRSALSTVKVGGTLVYATCTLAPEENELVIEWILEKEKDAIQLVPINLSIPQETVTVDCWKNTSIRESVRQHCLRVVPTPLLEGFFIAKIQKIKSTIPKFLQHNS